MGIAYRPEIDGMRAIAVVAVVLYHARVGGAGFVGVDIFFVISGYLITSLLTKEWSDRGRIDLTAFYGRRVKRIFPAAILVTLVTVFVSGYLLTPETYVRTLKSAAASQLFVSNLFFEATTGDYFDGSSDEMPLLHFWSLAVEEQFYLFWPALLSLVMRGKSKLLVPILVFLVVGSFALAEYYLASNPEAAFFRMPARMWELGIGAIIAVLPAVALPRFATPLGILIVVAACVWPAGDFPGLGALPAVLGAALIIASVHGGAKNGFLASRPMVDIGLISYSLYLWHWPILSLYSATTIGKGDLRIRLALCLLAVLLACVSYRFLERPIRKLKLSARPVVFSALASTMVLSIGFYMFANQAYQRLGVDVSPAALAEQDRPLRTCHSLELESATPKCSRSEATKVGIWGDSMAYAWTPLVGRADPHWVAYTRDACGPYLGYASSNRPLIAQRCREYNRRVKSSVVGLDTLVLTARWELIPEKFDALGATLAEVSPRVGRILILGPTPVMRDKVPDCIRSNALDQCRIGRTEFDSTSGPLLNELRRVALPFENVTVVDMTEGFCDSGQCPVEVDGIPMYWDTHHVSSRAVAKWKLTEVGVSFAAH